MLKPTPAIDGIYEILKEEILDLLLIPEQILSENDLCKRFGVSRTPIRSVLQHLAQDGLVSIEPYKGSFITKMDFTIIKQQIYQRKAIEYMVIRDFMKRKDLVAIEELRFCIRSQEAIVKQHGIKEEFYEFDSKFHSIMFREVGVPFLWDQIQALECNYSRFRKLDIIEQENRSDIIEEHDKLLHIIENHQFDQLEDMITYHLDGGIRRLGDKMTTKYLTFFTDNSFQDIQ
ncbi:MAG: GntR family transcriptional regulator [Lachnospiraceae bacterium]|nr:GntR family transcriptional regulator [Lachnospiraceae bacterium]